MNYSERAYFDGDHCQHCADWQEHRRLERIERRRIRRVARREWDALPDYRSGFRHASAHRAAMPAGKLAELNAEWDEPEHARRMKGAANG